MKLLRNYYSRLTFISLLTVTLLVLSSVMIILTSISKAKEEEVRNTCDTALKEMTSSFDDIWESYYKVFLPLYNNANISDVQAFCDVGGGHNDYVVRRNFKQILWACGQQDSRIEGILFRRMKDDTTFWFSTSDQEMKEVRFEWEDITGAAGTNRLILGSQALQNIMGAENAGGKGRFAIQTGVVNVKVGKNYEFQMAVIYNTDSFDAVMSKYGIESNIRFQIATMQGMMLYDTFDTYALNDDGEEKWFLEDEEGIVAKEASGITNMQLAKRANCIILYRKYPILADYLVWNDASKLVVYAGVFLLILIFFVLLSINRLVSRKFTELENGMRRIESNDLGYRFEVGKNEDEFSRIAVRFNHMCDALEDMIDKNYVHQILQKNAEYKALQNSINPHFMHNSLEAIRGYLDKEGMVDGAEMVLLISRIFEYQIRGDSFVTIRKELKALQDYIDFAAIRFQYSFEYSIDFSEEILDVLVPKQIFQPVIENYFVHGRRDDGTDCICIYGNLLENGMVRICFSDNGRGASQEQIDRVRASFVKKQEDNFHIALHNVDSRLKIAFGEESGVEFVSNAPDPGVSVSLVFDKELKKEYFAGMEKKG